MDILSRIQHWSITTPGRTAHCSGERCLSYLELQTCSENLADRLAASLPPDHAPVAVIGHKQPEMLVAFLGCVKAGHPYIPIDDSLPQARIDAILEASKAPLTLTPARVQTMLSDVDESLLPRVQSRPLPEDPWYIIFTSGSTGEPKGVVITTSCLESFVNWMLSEQRFDEPSGIFLNQAPFSFDLSVMDLYLSLVTGGTLFSLRGEQIAEPTQLFRTLQHAQINVWVSTPSFARLCLAEPTFAAENYPTLKKFLFCGETLAPEVAGALLERFPEAEIWNTYGPTEATCAGLPGPQVS